MPGLDALAQALHGRPQDGQPWLDYIDALTAAGLIEASWQVLAQGRRLGLQGPPVEARRQDLLKRRGDTPPIDLNSLFAQKRYTEFEAIAGCLLIEHPANASLWGGLGTALYQLRKFPKALTAMQRAVELEPGSVSLRYNLALSLWELRRVEEARLALEEVLALNPDHLPALGKLGAALNTLGRPADALAVFSRAEAIRPLDAETLADMGGSYQALGQVGQAERLYLRALELDPTLAVAHSNLGYIHFGRHDFRLAEKHYREAIALQPNLAGPYVNLADGLMRQNRYVEAWAACIRAVELDPTSAPAHQTLGSLSSYLSDHSLVVSESDRALELAAVDTAPWETRLYTFSYHPDLSAEEIFREFVRWGDRFPTPVTDFSSHDRTPGRRLRIGYVSPDFRDHTSRFYFMPLMANHDHDAFETFAYSNVAVEDGHTQVFKQVFDHWRDIRGVSDQDAARMVREDRIDILVDGCNHMRDDRLGVFALKPAPIQVTWLGAAWTTGLKTIDYVLLDPHLAPEGTLASEEIVRLPNYFFAYRPREGTPEAAPLPALRKGHVTFGYTGRTERLNHKTFRVWGEILRRVPGSRLILDFPPFADPPTQQHYRQLMAKHGLDPDRVEMRRSPDIFDGLGDIDILLDCFPHSGGTMLVDALWMGVPVVTLKSRPPLGRIATGLLNTLGMADWAADTEAEYIDKAAVFAADLAGLATVRAGLRDRMKASPFMDEMAFARGVEDAYRRMWARWIGEAEHASLS